MARLVVNPGSPVAWEIQLKSGTNLIGRGVSNDFKIADPSVSGSHCQVTLTGNTAVLRDLGSTNGTFINRTQIQEATLQNGQTVHFGGVEAAFFSDAPGQADIIPSPPPPFPVGQLLSVETERLTRPSALEAPPVARSPVVVQPTARPTAVAVPSALPPVAAPNLAIPPGPRNCKFHPKTPARLLCNKCRLLFCDLCVISREVNGATHKFCRQCGTECVPVQVQVARPQSSKGFFPLLPGVFVYPFRGSGIWILFLSTIVLSALEFVGGGIGIFTSILATGYLFSWMQNIIHATASEDEEMPGLPAFDGLFGACLSLVGCVAVSFGPAIALAYFAISQEQPTASIALIPAIVFGCIYFPMALLAVAMKDSVVAANPLVVIPAICKVPLEYLTAVLLLGAVFGVRALGESLLVAIFGPHGLTTHSMAVLFALAGSRAFWSFTEVYLLAVNMRILGLLYITKKRQLGWFEH